MRTRTVAGIALAVVLASSPGAWAADPPAGKTPPPPEPPTLWSNPGELPPIVLDPKHKISLELHGALDLLYYQPFVQLDDPHPGTKGPGPDDHTFEIFVASLKLEAKMDAFGIYVNPRVRDTKFRDSYPSNVWLYQGYVSYDAPHAQIKIGKIENQFSRLDDESFTQNTLFFDGIKYESDMGLSVEGAFLWPSGFALSYAAQYFVTDAHTNGSLKDRDTVWVTGARREHIGVLRLEPSYRFSKEASLRFGLAGEVFHVDLGDGTTKGPVARVDTDVSFVYDPVRLFAEGAVQMGKSVNAYPFPATPATKTSLAVPGRGSALNIYAVAGAVGRVWRFYPRYAISLVRYADVGVTEMVHVPGVTFVAHDNVSVLVEWSYWPRIEPSRSLLLDSALNVLLHGRF